MQYNLLTSEDQQELSATQIESEQDMVTDKRPPAENQIDVITKLKIDMFSDQQEKLAMLILASYSISCQLVVWKDHQTYDRSFLFPEVLKHDKYPEEVHACAAKTSPKSK
jgi:hypothetical protein